MSERILVVEDDPPTRGLIVTALTHAGFSVQESCDADSAWRNIVASAPDAMLLDWMLPGLSGFQLLCRLRADIRMRDLPVIMLTARSEEVHKIAALDAGVDDYVTKPFSPRELIARIKAVLRRSEVQSGDGFVELGDLSLIAASHKAMVRGKNLALGPVEFRLLHFFMKNAERVHNRRHLINNIWGECSKLEERTVDVHIRRLRSALEKHECDSMVQTVQGAGYRFSIQPDG